jgi:hypothetical protein
MRALAPCSAASGQQRRSAGAPGCAPLDCTPQLTLVSCAAAPRRGVQPVTAAAAPPPGGDERAPLIAPAASRRVVLFLAGAALGSGAQRAAPAQAAAASFCLECAGTGIVACTCLLAALRGPARGPRSRALPRRRHVRRHGQVARAEPQAGAGHVRVHGVSAVLRPRHPGLPRLLRHGRGKRSRPAAPQRVHRARATHQAGRAAPRVRIGPTAPRAAAPGAGGRCLPVPRRAALILVRCREAQELLAKQRAAKAAVQGASGRVQESLPSGPTPSVRETWDGLDIA